VSFQLGGPLRPETGPPRRSALPKPAAPEAVTAPAALLGACQSPDLRRRGRGLLRLLPGAQGPPTSTRSRRYATS